MSQFPKPVVGTAILLRRRGFSNWDYHRWFVYRHVMRYRMKVYWFSVEVVRE